MRIRVVDAGGVLFYTAREPEAEALLKAGMARPVGKGSKIRCLQLSCSRKQAHVFLRGGRSWGQASKTFRVERVGDQRHRLFVHDVDRCLSFRPELEITAQANEKCLAVETSDPEPANTCEQVPAVDNSCAQQETEIAVHSDEGREVGEREPERVPVEPETPDVVAVPAKQPHDSTVPADPNDMSGLRKLAAAVLVRAFEDCRTDSQARRWFEVTPQPMLRFWCQVLGIDPERFRRRALEAAKNGKVMAAVS